MADPILREILEDARVQPQHSTFDPLTCEIEEETSRAQPQQLPNDGVTASEIEEETSRAQPQQLPNDGVTASEREGDQKQRIDPELLRAIVNGDLMEFKKILGIEEAQIDIESIRVTRGGNSGLSGVTCGENTALHVVAGVMVLEEKSSSTAVEKLLNNLLPLNGMGVLAGGTFSESIYLILINPLLQTFSFVFPIKRTRKCITEAYPREHTAYTLRTNLQVVIKFLTVNAQWIRQKVSELIENARRTWWLKWVFVVTKFLTVNPQWIRQKEYELIEKARRTRGLKWVFPSLNVSVRMHVEIAEIICRLEPTLLNARNNATKETPLHCAAKAGKLDMVSLLVNFAKKEGPQKLEEVLWARNQVGETALHEAARFGYSDIVKELLGADETVACLVDDNGISPLYWAVASGCLDSVLMLIAPERLTSYAGPDGQTALHAAVMIQEENIMRVILEWKESLAEETDEAGNTPLHYAALNIGNTYAVRKLLMLKDTRSVYIKNLSGSFPVHLAAEAGNVKAIKQLLDTCPDVGELLDQEKRNFLHVAVQKERIRVIMFACREGINASVINAKDKDGNTPLHLAVIHSHVEIFALLSQNKRVNSNIRNEAGLTPLDISASLQDDRFTYSLNPQSIIYRALLTRGAFQNRCQPDLPKLDDNVVKKDDGASVDCPNRREGKEMSNGVGVDIEKESTKYENMSKSLVTGAVLIASATFVAIFTVSGVYRGDNTSHTLTSRRNVFKAFIIADVLAFICAIVSTIWLLYSALSNFHLKYRKFYFQRCTPLLYGAINLFILTFGLGGYIAIAPLSEWLALLIFVVCGIAILSNIIWNPKFVPLIQLAPYVLLVFIICKGFILKWKY